MKKIYCLLVVAAMSASLQAITLLEEAVINSSETEV